MSKIKVLHVVTSMGFGGVERWVLNLIKESQASDVHMDILAYSDENWPFAQKAKEYGSKIFGCPHHRNPVSFYKTLSDINKKHGPYQVIHAHNLFFNGVILTCAKMIGIPIRISHSHTSEVSLKEIFFQRLYHCAMSFLVHISGTHLFAVSEMAGKKLYRKKWRADHRHKVVYCGLDFSSFDRPPAQATRKEFGFPVNAKIVGHVGRFIPLKNHNFLLDFMADALKADPLVWLMLVGDGYLKSQIEEKANRLGISNRIIFTGSRSDATQLMIDCFDMFVLPSHHEGLGLVILEALAAGKKCLISDSIPSEADLIPALVHRLPLSAGSFTWATKVLEIINSPAPITQAEALSNILLSDFTIQKSFTNVRSAYKAEDLLLTKDLPKTN